MRWPGISDRDLISEAPAGALAKKPKQRGAQYGSDGGLWRMAGSGTNACAARHDIDE